MRPTHIIDLSLAEIMSRWPSTIRVFLDRRMHCVGCPIAPFHTLVDAAEEHSLLLAGLVAEVENARFRDSQASGHHPAEPVGADREPAAFAGRPRPDPQLPRR